MIKHALFNTNKDTEKNDLTCFKNINKYTFANLVEPALKILI